MASLIFLQLSMDSWLMTFDPFPDDALIVFLCGVHTQLMSIQSLVQEPFHFTLVFPSAILLLLHALSYNTPVFLSFL